MHDEKIAKIAFEYTMKMATMLDMINKHGASESFVENLRITNHELMGTHVYEIIENQNEPSIIGLTISINNLLRDRKFLNNFKFNKISDKIEQIQNWIIKDFPHVYDDLNTTIIKREKE